MGRRYIGVDLGGTKCEVIHAEVNGGEIEILDTERFATGADARPDAVLSKICSAARGFGSAPEAIGVSCGGPLDAGTGRLLSPPNLPLWDDIPICDRLTREFGVPAYLLNDADACALAEWRFGAGRGCENMIFLTFGTGLGAGLILNGRLYSGTNGMAGEAGHIRLSEFGPSGYGKAGSFEGFCSGGGIAQIGRTLGLEAYQNGETPIYFTPPDGGVITAKSVAEAAAAGDRTAADVYETCGRYLGRGLSILIDLLNPRKIVIGSIFARSRDLIWRYAEKTVEKEALPRSRAVCEIVPAALGERIGNYAAVAAACYNGSAFDDR